MEEVGRHYPLLMSMSAADLFHTEVVAVGKPDSGDSRAAIFLVHVLELFVMSCLRDLLLKDQ